MEDKITKSFYSVDDLILSFVDFEKIKHVYLGEISVNEIVVSKNTRPLQTSDAQSWGCIIRLLIYIMLFLGFYYSKEFVIQIANRYLWAKIVLGLIFFAIVLLAIYFEYQKNKNKIKSISLFLTTDSEIHIFIIHYHLDTKDYICHLHTISNLSDIQMIRIYSGGDYVQSNLDKKKFWYLLSETQDKLLEASFFFTNLTMEVSNSNIFFPDFKKNKISTRIEKLRFFIQFFRNNFPIND